MEWLDDLRRLRDARIPAVVVTLAAVRGHSPRDGGAKMIVTAGTTHGTIGGGNLEATAIDRAREMITAGDDRPDLVTMKLSEHADSTHGVQCCGGEVTMLLEPVPTPAAIAIFGMGHVGLELARVLSRHDLDLHLVDSRREMLTAGRLEVLDDAVARIRVHHSPAPESALLDLPPRAHVLVMTHDHAEDLAITDQSLRTAGLASVGLIGSRSKWTRFRAKLTELGHDDEALNRVTTPIGLPELHGKEPAVIAVSVAARLLQEVQQPQGAQ